MYLDTTFYVVTMGEQRNKRLLWNSLLIDEGVDPSEPQRITLFSAAEITAIALAARVLFVPRLARRFASAENDSELDAP
jgi:hypothetical protein